MIWISNHDAVENFDFEKLTSSNEVTGDFYVGFRWRWITTRMRDNDSGSTGHYCQSKDFPRMTKDCIHRANGHPVVIFNTAAGVEDEYRQKFTFRIERWIRRRLTFPWVSCEFSRRQTFSCDNQQAILRSVF